MATRHPLILVNGVLKEIPATDGLSLASLHLSSLLQVDWEDGSVSFIASDDVTLGNAFSFINLRKEDPNQWHAHPNDLMFDTTGQITIGDPQQFADKTYIEVWDQAGGGARIRLQCHVGKIYIGDTEGLANATQFIVDDANHRYSFDTANALDIASIAFPIIGGGVRIGESSSDKFAFWGATPNGQLDTGVAAASFTANSGTAVNDASTFDGYTLKQIVKALREMGLLA